MGEAPFESPVENELFENPERSPAEVAQAMFEHFLSAPDNLKAMQTGEGIGGQALAAEIHRYLKDIEGTRGYGKQFALLLAPFLQAELRSKSFLENYKHEIEQYNPDMAELLPTYNVTLFTRAARRVLSEYLGEREDEE
jgi:hypothetical protein